MSKKRCAYCNSENNKRSDEHIFPNCLIELYPEQDISFTSRGVFVDNRGLTISDVCKRCNEGFLSILDLYGLNIIKKYFYIPYEFHDYYNSFQIELNHDLFLRWILKILFNYLRSEKLDISYITKYLSFIKGEEQSLDSYVNIFIGFHVNLNPVPEEFFDYIPLSIHKSPSLILNSCFEFMYGKERKEYKIRDVGQSFSIRLGNCIVFVILWDDSATNESIINAINFLESDFRFSLIKRNNSLFQMRCISSPTNVMLSNYGHFFSHNAVIEILSTIKDSIQGRNIDEAKSDFCKDWTPLSNELGRALVEAGAFPKNTKKQRKLETLLKANKNIY